MTEQSYSSFMEWYRQGRLAPYVRTRKSAGGFLHLLEAAQPGGDMSDPAVPDIVLYQDLIGGSRVSGNLGGGRFSATSERGGFFLAAPNFANTVMVGNEHQLRSLSFPLAQWANGLEESLGSHGVFDGSHLHKGTFTSPTIRSALQQLWRLCDEEGAASRLLSQAAGWEILAELYRLKGTPLTPARGGLASWAERRCLDMMRERLAEDISLDELAAEARLSPFHFARMFKQRLGLPPRAYLVRLRMERACELLETTDRSIMEIALQVGYSSSQVLARVFTKYRHMSPSAYRRTVRDPRRPVV